MIKILTSFYDYVYMDASVEDAERILKEIAKVRGETEDLMDALRILKNFNTFYGVMKRKFKEFIAPRKRESDLILGKVVIEKLKLYVKNKERRVTVVFDKRFKLEELKGVMESIGLNYEVE